MENKAQCLKETTRINKNIGFLKDDEKTRVNPYAKEKMLKEYEERTGKKGNKRNLSRIPLWYFLHEILGFERCKSVIFWENKDELVFTIKKPKELAILWGQIKNKTTMTYAKLARGIRYYYGKGVIEKYRGKRFTYQFIVSKKTSSILLQKSEFPNIKEENDTSCCLKRKYLAPETQNSFSARPLKRSRSMASTDSSDRMSMGSSEGSSDNESEYTNLEELESLDLCLNDIFSDEARMKDLFTDITIFTETSERKSSSGVNTSFDFDLDEFLTNESGNIASEKALDSSNDSGISEKIPDISSNSPLLLEEQLHSITETTQQNNMPNISNSTTLENIRQSLINGQDYCSRSGNSQIKFYDSTEKLDNMTQENLEPSLFEFSKAFGRRKSRSESDIQNFIFNEQFQIKSEPLLDNNTNCEFKKPFTQNLWGNLQPPTMILPTLSFPLLNGPSVSFENENLQYYNQ